MILLYSVSAPVWFQALLSIHSFIGLLQHGIEIKINACAAHSYAGSYGVRFYMILVKTGKEVLNVPPYNALRSIADIIGSGSNGAYHKLIAAEASAYLISIGILRIASATELMAKSPSSWP